MLFRGIHQAAQLMDFAGDLERALELEDPGRVIEVLNSYLPQFMKHVPLFWVDSIYQIPIIWVVAQPGDNLPALPVAWVVRQSKSK